MEAAYLQERDMYDPYPGDFNDWNVPFWATPAGIGARVAIFFGIVIILLTYFIGGSISARKRFARGQKPIWGTAWMLRRQQSVYPNQYPMYSQPAQPRANNDAFGYHVPAHQMPPPAYNADQPPPAVYEPVRDGSKIAADQTFSAQEAAMHGSHNTSNAAATSGTTGATSSGAGAAGAAGGNGI